MSDYEENHEHYHHHQEHSAEKSRDHSFTGLLMLLAGVTTGIAVGLLFAPASGEETRQYLMYKCDETLHKIGQRTEKLRESGHEQVEAVRKKVRKSKKVRPIRRDS